MRDEFNGWRQDASHLLRVSLLASLLFIDRLVPFFHAFDVRRGAGRDLNLLMNSVIWERCRSGESEVWLCMERAVWRSAVAVIWKNSAENCERTRRLSAGSSCLQCG